MQGTQLQLSPPGWPGAVAHLPAGTPFLVIDGVQRLVEAKQANGNLFTIVRHYFPSDRQDAILNSITGLDHAKTLARQELATFVDGSFLQIAGSVNAILEYNEYSYNGDVTPEQMDWMAYEFGAAYVPHDPHHYWKRTMWIRAVNEVWDAMRKETPALRHIRLISVNSPPGNSIPLEWARIAARHGGILGHHPYTAVTGGDVRFDDGKWYSGRWRMDDLYFRLHGVKVEWLGTEAGAIGAHENGAMYPYDGWHKDWVLGGDMNRYIALLKYRLAMIQAWNAQHGNRYRGDALFLSGGQGEWANFEISPDQLIRIAAEAAAPVPGSSGGGANPTPDPQPQPGGETVTTTRRWNLRSKPRLDYTARLVTLPAGTTLDYAGETVGDTYNGSSRWIKVTCYVHEQGVE